jgi:WD40 repeat protein
MRGVKKAVAIVALGAALVLASVGCGGSARAAAHGILFVGRANYGKWRIFLERPGSTARALGRAGYNIYSPQWSPDGRSIAWEQAYIPAGGASPESDGIFLMRPDGTHVEQLTEDDYYDGAPSWSPDGRHVAYVREGLTGGEGLVIVDVRSRHQRILHLRFPYLCPGEGPCDVVWGKPGIAYSNNSGIVLVNPATGRSRLVARGDFVGAAAWSPGGVLAAIGPTRILLVTASGRILGKLQVPAPMRQRNWDVLGSVCGIAWSPSGVLAAVESTRIVLLAASGRVLGELPIPPAIKPVCDVAWSPDGKQILAPTVKFNGGLWVGTVSTKHWQRLPTPIGSTWSDSVSWR